MIIKAKFFNFEHRLADSQESLAVGKCNLEEECEKVLVAGVRLQLQVAEKCLLVFLGVNSDGHVSSGLGIFNQDEVLGLLRLQVVVDIFELFATRRVLSH